MNCPCQSGWFVYSSSTTNCIPTSKTSHYFSRTILKSPHFPWPIQFLSLSPSLPLSTSSSYKLYSLYHTNDSYITSGHLSLLWMLVLPSQLDSRLMVTFHASLFIYIKDPLAGTEILNNSGVEDNNVRKTGSKSWKTLKAMLKDWL